MEFVTEAWHPLDSLKIKSDNATSTDMGSPFKNYEVRHWLALIGVILFVLAPIVGMLSGIWISASLLASIALLMVSTATLLVPDPPELDVYESGQD